MKAIRPILPSDARVRDRRAAGGVGRRGHEHLHLVPAGVPARVRRHRSLRRIVRDRQLALDHDRAANPRARDAANARRLATSGPALDHHRGARRRSRGIGDRSLPGSPPREGPLRALRPRRLHPPEHRARLPHAHLGDRRIARGHARHAHRELATRDPRDPRSPDRGGSRRVRSSRRGSIDGFVAWAPC